MISRAATSRTGRRDSISNLYDTGEFPPNTISGRLQDWLESTRFEGFIAAALLANVLWMAVSLQVNGSRTGNELGVWEEKTGLDVDPHAWSIVTQIVDTIFAVFFASEVAIRIAVQRCRFFKVLMNFLDLVVSVAAVIEVALNYTVKLPVEPMLFRLLRVGKLVRAVRMVAMTSVLASLQLLVKCLAASRDMLWWSFCLLAFVQCVAGMILSTLCQDYIQQSEYDLKLRQEVFLYYGTFTRTVLTMFDTDMLTFMFFVCSSFLVYAVVCLPLSDLMTLQSWKGCVLGFAVLNVVNAVFVQQTMKTASSDEELAFRQKERDKATYTRKVKKLFQAMDFSGDGSISIDEFAKLVASPKLQFWISQLELEYHDLLSLFEFLDNGDGQITLNEFIEGAARLRGSAKALDVWRMETKVEVLFEEVLNLLKRSSSPATAPDEEDIVQEVFDQSLFKHIQTTARSRQISFSESPSPHEGQARQAFMLTLKDILPKEDFNVAIPRERLQLPVRLLELQTDMVELQGLADRYAIDAAKKKQASFEDSEVTSLQSKFSFVDRDGSGEIDRDEIPRLLKPMGMELKSKDDQRRLMALIADARRWAAECGVPQEECGKHGTAIVRFPVFLFMCRLLQREKEAKALAEEEEEARILGFAEVQVKKLHSKFCFWDFNLTLSVDGFGKLCEHINPRLSSEEIQDITAALPKLHDFPTIRTEAHVEELMKVAEEEEETEAVEEELLPEVQQVSFPLFVRSMKWMLERNLGQMQEWQFVG
eukprot:g8883.t1